MRFCYTTSAVIYLLANAVVVATLIELPVLHGTIPKTRALAAPTIVSSGTLPTTADASEDMVLRRHHRSVRFFLFVVLGYMYVVLLLCSLAACVSHVAAWTRYL